MNIKKLLILSLAAFATTTLFAGEVLNFNSNWKFHLVKNTPQSSSTDKKDNNKLHTKELDHSAWESVTLPHTANMEPLLVNNQWQGICWYRKDFDVENFSADKKYIIELEAAMNQSTIWINGEAVNHYQGGYLPVVIDATPYLKEKGNIIAIRLDNTDSDVTGPKPLRILDFNMYGGLYRNAWLITKNKTHITHPILANKTASGGLFVTTPVVSEKTSEVRIQAHVANETSLAKNLHAIYTIRFDGKIVATKKSQPMLFRPSDNSAFVETIKVKKSQLWSPDSPNLYSVEVEIYDGKELVDSESTRFGIRQFTFVDNQLHINGKKTYLRGVNRHQEYPYVGYALSDNAQYRDAKKIKDGGFDYVRLSHYPQSKAFMEACDELGLVVANAILGWQYYNETPQFKEQQYRSTRELVRRDRNHPCVMTWEASLNETKMPISFMTNLHNIVHEEYPGENTYSCGWMSDVYDIFFQARQHRILHPKEMTFEKPYMVSEYGDWEYYSSNAGLNQHNHDAGKRIELSSRQLRQNGETALLQQAHNLQEAHNDNMNVPATADSYWVMFDYNRGYHSDIESSGVMDIFRLPKFGYHLYASQRDVNSQSDIVLEIASYWDQNSSTDVRVFSNCDRVELYLNDTLIASQTPDSNDISNNLSHAPFTFSLGTFSPGTLRAEGYIGANNVMSTEVKTPQQPASLKIWFDESGRQAEAGCNDLIFAYIAAVDANGTICHDFTDTIEVVTDSKVEVMNTDGIQTEAGIATALLRIGESAGSTTLTAKSGTALAGSSTLSIK